MSIVAAITAITSAVLFQSAVLELCSGRPCIAQQQSARLFGLARAMHL